jgi:aryl-alcohol dehydrogenase-like predicted oxidoreductase
MQYMRLGTSGLVVSRLALGCLTFGVLPTESKTLYRVDEQSASRMVQYALEAGINFFDTSDFYGSGSSEEMLGRIIAPHRHDVILATKVGFRTGEALVHAGLSRRHILAAVDASLRRLGTEHVDVYIAHKEDPYTSLEETLEALNDVVRAGKARYLGFSNWSAWKAATALQMQKSRGWAQFVTGQVNYSLLQRDAEHELLPFMEFAGLGTMAWGPLAGGFLSGKYDWAALGNPDNRLSEIDVLPFDKQRGFETVEVLRRVAAERGVSVAQVAIAWILCKERHATAVVGATKLPQLEDNLQAAALSLSATEIAEMEKPMSLPRLYPHWHQDLMRDVRVHDALQGRIAATDPETSKQQPMMMSISR